MKAYWNNIRISPKKLRVVAEIVRWQDVTKALDFLKFAPTKWAGLLYKLVYSAMSNAVNNDGQSKEDLILGTIITNKGLVYKRGQAISRGRSHRILKRTTNVTVELQVKK